MRTVLGRVATIGLVAAAVAASATAAAASPPTTSTETTAATTTATSTTAVPGDTTTQPDLVVDGPAEAGRATPSRGSQIQLTPTDPPPPTTTTIPIPAFLRLPENSGEGRRIVYHKTRQRVWVVEANGGVSKTHAVSGRLSTRSPLAGTYEVFSRSKYTCNLKNPNICWRFMVRFAKGPNGDNIGFHEIPVDKRTGDPVQSISQLGQPLSGGCVRQATPDAIFIWEWAPLGTPVVVIQ